MSNAKKAAADDEELPRRLALIEQCLIGCEEREFRALNEFREGAFGQCSQSPGTLHVTPKRVPGVDCIKGGVKGRGALH